VKWIDPESAAAAIIYLASGMLILPFAYGRVIAHLRESIVRSMFTRFMLVGCTVACFLFGYWRGFDGWLAVPAIIWLAAAVLEIERLIMQRKYRSTPPAEEDVESFSLLKPFTTTSLAVRRYELPVEEWKTGRLRIAHISDLHVHKTLEVDYFQGVVEKVKSLNPDAVFITGDFISRARYAHLLPEALKGLDARLGVYASLGNHDYWSDIDLVKSELAKTNVQLCGAEGRIIESGDGARLLVSACDDPWGPAPWIPPDKTEGTPLAVLSHTADNIYRLSEAGSLAVFTGHYHAGQGAVPWYGPLVIPSKYGRRFDHGHFLVKDTHLYVTAGIGIAFPPFRIYCHPEVLVVDLAARG